MAHFAPPMISMTYGRLAKPIVSLCEMNPFAFAGFSAVRPVDPVRRFRAISFWGPQSRRLGVIDKGGRAAGSQREVGDSKGAPAGARHPRTAKRREGWTTRSMVKGVHPRNRPQLGNAELQKNEVKQLKSLSRAPESDTARNRRRGPPFQVKPVGWFNAALPTFHPRCRPAGLLMARPVC